MDYYRKIEDRNFADLSWNIPETRQGALNIIGGNSQSFKTEIRITETVSRKYPIDRLSLVLPDALKTIIPNIPDVIFLPSTESGSFGQSEKLQAVFNSADYNLVLGDLSKNNITSKALVSTIRSTAKPVLITRDAVDSLIAGHPDDAALNQNLVCMASLVQLQKLLRSLFYPKMLLLSQSLMQVVEVLHKFTLSYPMKIITLHNGQILIAEDGRVSDISLEFVDISAMQLWLGNVAADVAIFNLYNPNNFTDATISALLKS